jgi:5-methylcytosine-specific restriction endonuclease McrA
MADPTIHYAGTLVSFDAARGAGLTFYFPGTPCNRGHVAQRYTKGRHCVECASGRSLRLANPENYITYYTGPTISREDAIRAGLKSYFHGRPCPRGHIAQRFTKRSLCAQCVKERHRPKNPQGHTTYYVGPIIDRDAARSAGLKRYFTGEPCLWLHIDQRSVSSNSCIQCRKERLLNLPIATRQTYLQRARDRARKSYDEDPEYKARSLQSAKDWQSANPDRRRINSRMGKHNRRARQRNAPGTFTHQDIETIRLKQKNRCAACRRSIRSEYHPDHVLPLKLGGSNWPENIQLLCPKCNLKKHAKHPDQWAKELGLLFC